METLKPVNYPKTVDISMTGKCQLDCAWCWGEEHTVGTIHGEDKWKELLRKFKEIGTSNVVFTGGEPLLSPSLPEVLRYAKESLSMRTTLSTNAILLDKLHEYVLPWVDDLGISLDGSTSEINKRMRDGKIDNFQKVIDGIKLVQDAYPNIDLTVRTVIARPNIHDVENIPQTLTNNDIDLSRIRYKLYQVEPIGPRANATNTDVWRVSEDECRSIESRTKERYPDLSVTLQLYSGTSGRYYQIGPRGNAYGTYIDNTGSPQMIQLGNPIYDFNHALGMIASQYSFQSTH
jgi:MoaA/NifB/PqqE/SkfB family radical SAM enzyme